MKKTKKSLVLSIVTLLLCSCMFIGSTFAWFTDTVSNTGNKIQAGTLDIDLLLKTNEGYKSLETEKAPVFDYDKWEPGYSDGEVFEILNKGNLALKYNLQIALEGGTLNENAEGHTLADVIDVYFVESNTDITKPTSFNEAETSMKKVGTLADVLGSTDTRGFAHGVLLPKDGDASKVPSKYTEETKVEKTYVAIVLHMQEDAGNEYQNMEVGSSFDIRLVATQVEYEKDGFNSNEYDVQAEIQPLPNPVHIEVETPEPINKNTPSSGDEKASFTGSGAVKSAEVKMSTVKGLLPGVGGTVDTHTVEESDSVDMKMNLKVDSTDVSEDSVTYDLSLFKTVTVTNNNVQVAKEKSQVTEKLETPVTAVIQLESNLNKVVVKHSGTEMEKLATVDANPENIEVGGYFYNFTNGELTVKAAKFSPFTVSYKNVEGVACIVRGENVIGYNTFIDALNDQKDGETVTLLQDITGSDTTWQKLSKGTYTLDLGGHDIIGPEVTYSRPTLQLHMAEGSKAIITDSSNNPGSIINYRNEPPIIDQAGNHIQGTIFLHGYPNYTTHFDVEIENVSIINAAGKSAITNNIASSKESLVVKSGKIQGDIYLDMYSGGDVITSVYKNVEYTGTTKLIESTPSHKVESSDKGDYVEYKTAKDYSNSDLLLTNKATTQGADENTWSSSASSFGFGMNDASTKYYSVKVCRNIDASSKNSFTFGTTSITPVTLDLNGKEIKTAENWTVFSANNAANTLTIKDSVGGATFYVGLNSYYGLQVNKVTLIIENGNFTTSKFTLSNSGTVQLKGGSYTVPSGYVNTLKGFVVTGSTVTINGESYTAE